MKVKEVIANDKKVSKAGKPYWNSKVILDTQDKPVYALGYAKVGNEVTHEKKEHNGTVYDNYKIVKPNEHEEVMQALRTLYRLNTSILKAITGEGDKSHVSEPKTPPASSQSVENIIDSGEPLSLDDIPL